MLRFDLSAIPAGATIVGCDLYLYINTEGQDFALYRCLVSWDESSTHSSVNLGNGIPRDDVAAAAVEDAVHGAPNSVAAGHGYNGITGTVHLRSGMALPLTSIATCFTLHLGTYMSDSADHDLASAGCTWYIHRQNNGSGRWVDWMCDGPRLADSGRG